MCTVLYFHYCCWFFAYIYIYIYIYIYTCVCVCVCVYVQNSSELFVNYFTSLSNSPNTSQCTVIVLFHYKVFLWFQTTGQCGNLLDHIENMTAEVLPLTVRQNGNIIIMCHLNKLYCSELSFVQTFTNNPVYVVSKIECDQHFECDPQWFRDAFRFIINWPK